MTRPSHGIRIAARLRAAAFPILVGLASRLFSIVLLVVIPGLRPGRWPLLTHIRSPFLAWDGQWYLSIADRGYHAAAIQVTSVAARHDYAFYPGWPGLVSIAGWLGASAPYAAVVGANALFVAALIAIFAVLTRRFGAEVARRGVVLLAFAPPAYVLSMGYSESLFLLVVGLYFVRPTARWRPLAAASAILVRVAGLAVLASALAIWARDRRARLHFASAAAVVIALAGWSGYVWWLSGDPLGWLHGALAWGGTGGIPGVVDAIENPTIYGIGALAFLVLMLAGAWLIVRRDLELGVYALVAIGLGIAGGWVTSMPRYSMVAFPAFAALGLRAGRRGTIALAIAFAVAQAASVYFVFDGAPTIAP